MPKNYYYFFGVEKPTLPSKHRHILELGTEQKIIFLMVAFVKKLLVWCKDSMQFLPKFQWLFSQNRKKNFKIYMEPWKTINSQNTLEKGQSCRLYTSWFQAILQSYSNQNSMVLTWRQTYRSMKQNKKSRSKAVHIWSINFWQGSQENIMRKGWPHQ